MSDLEVCETQWHQFVRAPFYYLLLFDFQFFFQNPFQIDSKVKT